MTNENPAMTTLTNFLDENGWRYLTDEDGAVRGLLTGASGHCHWYANLNADGRFLMFRSYCPVNIPARRRAAASEYLTRANWGMTFGNFEMDWSDGQVCFRTTVTADGAILGDDALSHLVFANHSTIDRYLAGLLAVGCGSTSPGKAINEAEKDLRPPANAPDESAAPTTDEGAGEGPRKGRNPRKFTPNDN